jgi:hypothetical protein
LIVAVVDWEYFAGVVVVVVVVTAIVSDVVNAGEVVSVVISTDVMDVTVRNDRVRVLQVPVLCEDRGVVRVGACFAGTCTRVGECFADTKGSTL